MSAHTLDPLWKALADPSRRQILDLLRERPHTTGELAEVFDFTRFAVMKHLKVLTEAQLVTVRREGRERWNHLNAVPLQRLYERWIRPFEGEWATQLLRLQAAVEHPETLAIGDSMPMTTPPPGTIESLVVEQEITLAAPRERVFDALVGDISPWWGRPYTMNAERASAIEIEPRVGGRFWERWGEEEGALWCVVTHFEKGRRLDLTGSMGMGGAVQGITRYVLEDAAGGTRLRLSHHAFGEISEAQREGYTRGWDDLLDRRLRAWLEKGERMGMGHEPPMPEAG